MSFLNLSGESTLAIAKVAKEMGVMVSCDLNITPSSKNRILNYSTVGNGSIICVYESGAKFNRTFFGRFICRTFI